MPFSITSPCCRFLENFISSFGREDNSQEEKFGKMSRQLFGIRHARPGGNVVHAELHTNERVETGFEGNQAVRDHDWTDLTNKLVDLTMEHVVGRVGNMLSIC